MPGGVWADKGNTPPNAAQDLKYFGNGLLFHTADVTGGVIRRSSDAGDTWTNLPTPDSSLKPIDLDRGGDGRVWSLWQGSNFLRVYYSDSNGDSWSLSKEIAISTGAAGSISAHPGDQDRVAVAWVTGSALLRVSVTTDRGATWNTYSPGFAGGIAPQVAWSGSRLVLVADSGSTLRLLLSQNDGVNWTQQSTFSTTAISTTGLGIVRGPGDTTLFAFASSQDAAPTHVVLRSTDQGSTWTQAAALPSGQLLNLRALAYDPGSDTVYVAWQMNSRVTRLRAASTRDWAALVSGDWEELPQLGITPAVRGLVLMPDR